MIKRIGGQDLISSEQIELIIDRLINREGGFVDRPVDQGGPTKFGLTMDALTEAFDRQISPDDVRVLQYDVAQDIYTKHWFKSSRLHLQLVQSPGIAEMIFDTAAVLGRERAARWTQEIANVVVDGFIGPMTHSALDDFDLTTFVDAMAEKRSDHYKDRAVYEPDIQAFWDSWNKRLADVSQAALSWEKPIDG